MLGRGRVTWSQCEENQLRVAWQRQFPNLTAEAKYPLEVVKTIGAEPYGPPDLRPSMELDDSRLFCWLASEAQDEKAPRRCQRDSRGSFETI